MAARLYDSPPLETRRRRWLKISLSEHRRIFVKEDLLIRKAGVSRRPRLDFDFAKESIAKIYPNNAIIWFHAGPGFHFSKLAEEVAEIHEALAGHLRGKRPLSAVSDEIADVLAWILGAWKIKLEEKSVDKELLNYFFNGCPVCNKKRCNCAPYSGKAHNLFDPTVLQSVDDGLQDLVKVLPQSENDIAELRRSIKVVMETQDDPLARLLLSQISLKLKRFEASSKTPTTIFMPIISTILNHLAQSENS